MLIIANVLYLYMSNTKLNENMKNLTSKENETFNILVKLGDSKELAFKTVVSERKNEAKKESAFYTNAYTN